MSNGSAKTADDRAKRAVEEGNSQAQQQQNTETSSDEGSANIRRMPHTTSSRKSESSKDSRRSKHHQEEEAIVPSEIYDPENPMPYFLSQEAKHVNFAKHMEDPAMREFRVADVENVLSFKSIFCWSSLAILLVGGSLVAVVMTVDWNSTGDGDADMTNSPMGGSPWISHQV